MIYAIHASTSLKFILFADDTNVCYSGVDIQTICECISRELDKLHVWLSVNKLSLNVDKTNFILFGNRKNIDNVCISLNNSIITRVRATKFLGVIIHEKLTWKDHISLVRSKLSKTVGILYRIRHLLNRSALFILYCSLFLPYNYTVLKYGETHTKATPSVYFFCKRKYETQKLFCYLKKKSNGVYYPRMYHMFEYLRFEKHCSKLNIIAKLISLIC